MYTTINFKTKKELKERVKAYNEALPTARARLAVTYYQPNSDVTGFEAPRNGTIYCEGPHYPQPHTWYAQCEAKDGVIIKVK